MEHLEELPEHVFAAAVAEVVEVAKTVVVQVVVDFVLVVDLEEAASVALTESVA